MQDHISRLTDPRLMARLVRERLDLLHIDICESGCDAGLYDAAVDGAIDEAATVSGDPDAGGRVEMYSAIADIAASELARAVMLGARGDGVVSARTDGDLSVKYASGTSQYEERRGMADRMRERGISAVRSHRRLRW